MFESIFKKDKGQLEAPSQWIKCPSCKSLMYYKEIEIQLNVCPKCNHHFRITAMKRIEAIVDEGTFKEYDKNLAPIDPLNFSDKKSYKKRIEEAKAKTGKTSSVMSGRCTIGGNEIEIVVFDFSFMGGSLGSVEGEKIVRGINRAIEKNCGFIIVSASGGARMQESTYALLQMSKTSAALNRLHHKGLPFISILTDPTMGGVSASFAMLGDIIMAEPGALIGFAGQRVIKQTVGVDLPEGFQRSEFLLEHGLIDMIVDRMDLHQTLSDLFKLLKKEPKSEKIVKEPVETKEIDETIEEKNDVVEVAQEKEESDSMKETIPQAVENIIEGVSKVFKKEQKEEEKELKAEEETIEEPAQPLVEEEIKEAEPIIEEKEEKEEKRIDETSPTIEEVVPKIEEEIVEKLEKQEENKS